MHHVDIMQRYLCRENIIIGKPVEWKEGKLRAEDDYSVDMDVTHCGICGSDIHTMDSGWGPTKYPCVASFQIISMQGRSILFYWNNSIIL